MGKALYINLANGKIKTNRVDEQIYRELIGGKGIGAYLALQLSKPRLDPLDPQNPLIFTAGPLNGTPIYGACKLALIFKSPLTKIFGESYCGGSIASSMKYSGHDILVITGKSDKPVCIVVSNNEVKIVDASHLWGTGIFETEDALKRDFGDDFQVASIGPAGENLVKFACIGHDRGEQFGRCGAGAVMGSKRLKAIAFQGDNPVSVHDVDRILQILGDLKERLEFTHKALATYGTPSIMALTQEEGVLPTRYWTEGNFEGFEKVNAQTMKTELVKKDQACDSCPLSCRKISIFEANKQKLAVVGPDYETVFALGPLCGVSDLQSIAYVNYICDDLGLDTITLGNLIAFVMYCYERGIITKDELYGLDAKFGHIPVPLIEKIAKRENGLGNILAEGTREAAKIIGRGSEDFCVHVKGLEFPGYDPRGLKGVALAYGTSSRGACHLRHVAYRPNLVGKHPFDEKIALDRLSYINQPEIVKELEDFHALVDSMVLCKFLCLPVIGPILWKELVELYSAVTGVKIGVNELRTIGERINDLARFFNQREGISRKDDLLPPRMFDEPLYKGASEGEVVSKKAYEEMLNKYYRLRGWDDSGFVPSERLQKLNLSQNVLGLREV